MARQITEDYFILCVGSSPEQDDLERCNCPKAGQPGHTQCGWNERANLPCFMVPTYLSALGQDKLIAFYKERANG